MPEPGVFYGVGVGPGDPELLTLKALRTLKAASVIAVPKSSDGGSSRALSILKGVMDISGKEVMELLFPMTKDKALLGASRADAASRIACALNEGKDVAFITLGDPMLYSTFSYLVPLVRERSGAGVRVIPGITSFSAGAARLCLPLAESDERIIIIPAAHDIGEIKKALEGFDTVILMKVNREIDRLIDLLCAEGLDGNAMFFSRAGWPDEEVVSCGVRELKGRRLDYFSTIIVKRNP